MIVNLRFIVFTGNRQCGKKTCINRIYGSQYPILLISNFQAFDITNLRGTYIIETQVKLNCIPTHVQRYITNVYECARIGNCSMVTGTTENL
jgi:hypothetical protein